MSESLWRRRPLAALRTRLGQLVNPADQAPEANPRLGLVSVAETYQGFTFELARPLEVVNAVIPAVLGQFGMLAYQAPLNGGVLLAWALSGTATYQLFLSASDPGLALGGTVITRSVLNEPLGGVVSAGTAAAAPVGAPLTIITAGLSQGIIAPPVPFWIPGGRTAVLQLPTANTAITFSWIIGDCIGP